MYKICEYLILGFFNTNWSVWVTKILIFLLVLAVGNNLQGSGLNAQ